MPVTITEEQKIHTLEFVKEEEIAAPIDVVWATMLEELGPLNEGQPGVPMPMKIEPWPGGRWMRDLGNDTGHWWANVQSFKPPVLLEFNGPLFMSCPGISNVQFRLAEKDGVTHLKLVHRAFGFMAYDPKMVEGMHNVEIGWGGMTGRIARSSEKNAKG